LFVIGVWVFRKYLLTKNWRITLVFTYGCLAIVNLTGIMITTNTWGISQNGWFYMGQNALPSIIQGLSQVLSCLAVIEISPPGLEATIYELLISSMNGATTLMVAFQSAMGSIFDLEDITAKKWSDNHCSATGLNSTIFDPQPICETYENSVTHATIFTIVFNIIGICCFVWFMPMNGAHCRQWASKVNWQNSKVGILNGLIFIVPFVYANIQVVADISG